MELVYSSSYAYDLLRWVQPKYKLQTTNYKTEMISRNYRFHGHNSLNYLFRKGKTVRAEFLSLRYAPSNRDDYRLAVVVSKKVSKSAVVRNRIRRRIYEIVRLMQKESDIPLKYDLSLNVYDERVAHMPHAELESSIKGLFSKAGI